MKIIVTISILICISSAAIAQDYAGYRTSNNTGVNGVFFNPANIADSRYRWDFTLFNVNATVGNNKASFKLKDIGKSLDGDSLKNVLFDGTGRVSALVSANVTGPSVFFNLDKKSALALTTRARVMSNVVNIDSKLAQQLIEDANADTDLPYTVSSTENNVVNANAWTEFGVSYARTILSKGNHFLKGGISLKYLAGAANASVNVDALNGTVAYDAVRDDTYLTNASGGVGLNFGGINLSDFETSDLLSFTSNGFGADIGFVYEYRPDTSDAVRNNLGEMRRDLNKYKFRIGLAVLDVGSVKYERDVSRSGAYRINIGASQRFYLSSLEDADDFKDTLDKYPQFFTPEASNSAASYSAAMPATLQVDVDYHLKKGFYVNFGAQLALTNSRTSVNASQYYNSVTLTPRLEGRAVGVYVPISYNALTDFTAGASFRVGPLFFGSGSVLSAALGSSKQADFFIGFHFGGLQKQYKAEQPKDSK